MADYGSLQDHADVILTLLRDQAGLIVYPDQGGGPNIVPVGALPPYVSAHFAADRPLGSRLDMRSTRMRVRIYCHCVGADDIGARAVSDLVADALLDAKVIISGRSCYPIRSETGRDPREDESTGRSFVTITDTYRLESEPGPTGS